MLVARPRPPGNLSHFQKLIAEIARVDGEVKRIQRAIANTIVGQMLPPSSRSPTPRQPTCSR